MNAKPTYRLKELIDAKYGASRFSTGCLIVAQWVYGQTGMYWTVETVETLCGIARTGQDEHLLTLREAEALRLLFNLHTVDELFTDKIEYA